MRLEEDNIFSVIALPCFVLLYPALLSIVLHDLVACFVCFGTCGFALWVYGSVVLRMFFGFVRFMSLLFGAVVRSVGNITRDFPFDWIVFASVSYNLRASHSPIVLKIRTRNFSLAATGIITETRTPPSPSRSQLAALFFNLDTVQHDRVAVCTGCCKISGNIM